MRDAMQEPSCGASYRFAIRNPPANYFKDGSVTKTCLHKAAGHSLLWLLMCVIEEQAKPEVDRNKMSRPVCL